jgi:hypothetical protein
MIIISLAGDDPDVRAFRYDGEIESVSIVCPDSSNEGAAV